MKEGVSLIGSGSSVTNLIGAEDNYGVLFDKINSAEISGFTFKSDGEHLQMSAFIICQSSSPIIKKNRFETELFQNIAVECSNNSNPIIEENYLKQADMWVNGSSPIIRNNSIICFSDGIRCFGNSNPEITGNKMTGNFGNNIVYISQSGCIIKNNYIYNNMDGWRIFLNNANEAKVFNNVIKSKGVNSTGIKIINSQNIEVVNNTILLKGIGINDATSTSNIFNNIVVNTSDYGIEFSDASQMDYNAFWNNPVNYSGINPGSNNIEGNILFADSSKENYRLLSNSPCINAGNPDSKYNDIDGSRNDIGAYGGPYADSNWINQDGSTLAVDQITDKDTIQILITGQKVKGIAGINLGLSYDPLLLMQLNANSSTLTKSFSVEEILKKAGSLNLNLNSTKGINEDEGGIIELQFETHSAQTETTTLRFDSASVWDETACSKNIINLKDGQLKIITGINKVINKLPTTYSLSQNYPNPFNPSTRVRFQLPVESKVTVKIYDILGREVITLLNETRKAGRYEVVWNAANYASGVYFYTIKALSVNSKGESFYDTKKLILLK